MAGPRPRSDRGRGVDVALVASGGDGLIETFDAPAPFGRLIVFGAASGFPTRLDHATIERWLHAPGANQFITGFNIGAWFLGRPEVAGPALMGLVEDVRLRALRLSEIATLPLNQAGEAHAALENRQTTGKIVLKPWQ